MTKVSDLKAKNQITWGVDLWGHAMIERWSSIIDKSGKRMTAYDFEDFPEAIKVTPCALSFIFPNPAQIDYSEGGMNTVHWLGQTEFHLTENLNKNSLSSVWQYFRKISEAAAFSLTLGGKVESFQILSSKSIELVTLQYGSEVEHYGLVAYWEVWESITGKLFVGI